MLITLNIEKADKKSLASFLHEDVITTEYHNIPEIATMNINCLYYRRKPDYNRILSLCGNDYDRVLCKENILPKNCGLERFCDNTLNIRMMENAILYILDLIPKNSLSIGISDPKGVSREFCRKLLKYSYRITVATEMKNYYPVIGALTLADTVQDLYNCDMIIHQDIITFPVLHKKGAFVFTACPPEIKTDDKVIYSYRTPVSKELLSIIPKNTDRQYFLCGAYSLCNLKELEQKLPEVCITSHGAVTLDYLKNRMYSEA